ncbi:formylglycine-generating enzyme family protein [Sphingomonas sp. 4RDLI-65]|uniref:formylglycine-generating enzyme family protein n=1 Tax=Sphingomonas sp. 4RDLI-65 TaxID=3111641 RepID=UPI003C159714
MSLTSRLLACAVLALPAALSGETVPYRIGAAFSDCVDCPDMVVVPPGRFVMGSTQEERTKLGAMAIFDRMESPRHPVSIAYKFAVARYSVTFAQWDACVADGGCDGYQPDDAGWGRGRRPVINVDFANANAFVAWLKAKTGQPYRLLSEAEWEHAGRAGTTGWWYFGNAITPDNANYAKNRDRTAPVGSYPPNAFGLYDMTGNTAQWVQDCYHNGYEGAPADGSPWLKDADCAVRNVRGGGWDLQAWSVRIAQRIGDPIAIKNTHLGFRVARDLPQ